MDSRVWEVTEHERHSETHARTGHCRDVQYKHHGSAGRGQNFFFVEETSRLPPDTTLPGTSSTDVDLVDVDDDGDLDLFVAEGTDSPAPRPNRLLLNDGTGVFTDVSATHLPPAVANSTKADFGDVDGDGDLDAIVANLGPSSCCSTTARRVRRWQRPAAAVRRRSFRTSPRTRGWPTWTATATWTSCSRTRTRSIPARPAAARTAC